MVRPGAVGWQIEDVAVIRHLRLVGTIPRGTEVLDRAGSWTPWRWVYTTRSGTSSQCSSVRRSRDKPRSNLWVLLNTQTAAFNTCCNLLVIAFGVPARTVAIVNALTDPRGSIILNNCYNTGPVHSYLLFPYLHVPPLHNCTWFFRTCIFHPYKFCLFVLLFSILALSSTCSFSAPDILTRNLATAKRSCSSVYSRQEHNSSLFQGHHSDWSPQTTVWN